MNTECEITVTVNGASYTRTIPARKILTDFIRNDLGLTGTHGGCDHGVCGSCTVQMNGQTVRSCLTLAVQADGAEIETVESLGTVDELHPIQKAFVQEHGLQCGYCTPGILMTVHEFLSQRKNPSEEEIRHAISGNLCRCTGYQNIVKAVMTADRIWER
ncbi:(2Fe-2S)-binding protein [Gemmobacter fulvus]|uniref:(2Fe-2S)-binding protein n=1 Tax=Gemmobacter fulvus TaxID=2840474 RepID=UPI0027964B2F|nr:(2Fe-2S)-binding protein [Gemmobacter fulvus]MDQ1850742.1 (2Fe-2S)-binding protein [Gemmobacter fulvus]